MPVRKVKDGYLITELKRPLMTKNLMIALINSYVSKGTMHALRRQRTVKRINTFTPEETTL